MVRTITAAARLPAQTIGAIVVMTQGWSAAGSRVGRYGGPHGVGGQPGHGGTSIMLLRLHHTNLRMWQGAVLLSSRSSGIIWSII